MPAEWADRYAGRFDAGWDAYREEVFARQKELGILPADAELSRHDPDVPDWASLPRRGAPALRPDDGGLRRLPRATRTTTSAGCSTSSAEGALDDTIVMVICDNGASAEGGPTGTTNEPQFFNNAQETLEDNLAVIDELGGPKHFNHYPWGWTFAGNTPFRRWKRETYRGGISDPLIVRWPAGIKAATSCRTQYAHVIDMVPTVLDCLGIAPPPAIRGVTQAPIEGVSIAHTFDDAEAASGRTTQYFEMIGHRSIYHDGWRAICPWPGPSFAEAGKFFGAAMSAADLAALDEGGWELYHVAQDVAENHDVAASHPGKLIELIAPGTRRPASTRSCPSTRAARRACSTSDLWPRRRASRYTFYPGTQSVPGLAARNVLNRPHSITAEVEIPAGGAEGVLLSQGSTTGGYCFYVKGDKLHYAQNYVGRPLHVESTTAVPGGRHSCASSSSPPAQPTSSRQGRARPAQLYVDGRLVGQAESPPPCPSPLGPGGARLRRRPGLAGDPRLRAAVRVHGSPRHGRSGRERGAHRRIRGESSGCTWHASRAPPQSRARRPRTSEVRGLRRSRPAAALAAAEVQAPASVARRSGWPPPPARASAQSAAPPGLAAIGERVQDRGWHQGA